MKGGATMNYRLMLVTDRFRFYADTGNEDINSNVRMYNTEGGLISNNYFAHETFFEECRAIVEEGQPYEYMDQELASNVKDWIKS